MKHLWPRKLIFVEKLFVELLFPIRTLNILKSDKYSDYIYKLHKTVFSTIYKTLYFVSNLVLMVEFKSMHNQEFKNQYFKTKSFMNN